MLFVLLWSCLRWHCGFMGKHQLILRQMVAAPTEHGLQRLVRQLGDYDHRSDVLRTELQMLGEFNVA